MERDTEYDVTVPLVDLTSTTHDIPATENHHQPGSGRSNNQSHESLPLASTTSSENHAFANVLQPSFSVATGSQNVSLVSPQVAAQVQTTSAASTRPKVWERRTRSIIASWTVFAIPILVIVCFSIWLFYAQRHKMVIGNDDTGVIGWRFSQRNAKAIETVWNALMAPGLFFVLDAFLFNVARVAMINEKSSKPIALRSLASASSTDAGTYNLWKIYKIIRKSRSQMLPFAILVVLSGIALGSLSNVIAYEAYTGSAGGASVNLPLLSSNLSDTAQIETAGAGFSTTQMSNFTGQVNGMLTALRYQSAEDKLDAGDYIGINATTASLNALPIDVVKLYNVPGYRLGIDCKAQPPSMFMPLQISEFYVTIDLSFDNRTLFYSYHPGQLAVMGNEYSDPFPFVAFSLDKTQLYLGSALRFNDSNEQTLYGEITYNTFKMVHKAFIGTKTWQSVYGFQCNVTRQTGHHNFTREKDFSWTRVSSIWEGPRIQTPLLISDWQVELNFHGPGGLMPGIGSAFWAAATAPNPAGLSVKNTDYHALALNFLYAAGETERIFYEVSSSEAVVAGGDTFNVQADKSGTFYHLTYVPALLIIGSLGIFLAFIV